MKYALTFKCVFLLLFVTACSSTGSGKIESIDPIASGYVMIVELIRKRA